MKIKLWMAVNKQGNFLCEGNPNPNLSYHLSYPYDCEYLCHGSWVMCRTKWEIQEHIRKWRKETRGATNTFCRATKMVVSWETAEGGAA